MFDSRYPSQPVRRCVVAEIPYKGTESSLVCRCLFLLVFNFRSFHGNLHVLGLGLSVKGLTKKHISEKRSYNWYTLFFKEKSKFATMCLELFSFVERPARQKSIPKDFSALIEL